MKREAKLTVFYDGKCLICIRLKLLTQKLDFFRVIEFIDLWRVKEDYRISKQTLAQEIHVIIDRGRVFKGYFAIREIIRRIPLLFPLSLLMNIPLFSYFGRRVYKVIALNRYKIISCRDGCNMPHYPAHS